MALIKCPECNHDVSTLAASCPNCGCPTSAMAFENTGNTMCEILGKRYELGEVLSLIKTGEKIKAIKVTRETTGLGLAESSYLVDEIIKNEYKIPPKSNITSNSRKQATDINQPKCPTCGSTDVMKQGITGRAVSGLIFGALSVEGRAQFICKQCGYKW